MDGQTAGGEKSVPKLLNVHDKINQVLHVEQNKMHGLIHENRYDQSQPNEDVETKHIVD